MTPQIVRLAEEVIDLGRDSLLVNFRFLDRAISALRPVPAELTQGMMQVDGRMLRYSPVAVLTAYKLGATEVTEAYLHAVMHCVFEHPFVGVAIERPCWDTACDIAAEAAIGGLAAECVQTVRVAAQQDVLGRLTRAGVKLTAEKIYYYLRNAALSEADLAQMRAPFMVDDHSNWYEDESKSESESETETEDESGTGQEAETENEPGTGQETETESKHASGSERSSESDDESAAVTADGGNDSAAGSLAQQWQEIASRMQTDLETFSAKQGDRAGALMQSLRDVTKERYDYTDFLKRFAVMGEVIKASDDEFDYIYYTYGMKLYGRMPLIEPLEYKDDKRIREFAIAIDTSGSVSGALVQAFVRKTYNILMQQTSFFKRVNIHIIQCDADIQEDRKITSGDDFEDYMKTMTLHGFGGTDFRPVFSYVDSLVARGEFANLKGLIYFTDGYGKFPSRQPPYETAFVFIDNGDMPKVPVWAIKLILPQEDIL